MRRGVGSTGNGNPSILSGTREMQKVQLVLLLVQLGYAGHYVLSKVALADGLNRLVLAVYRDCIGSITLFPIALYEYRVFRERITTTWHLCFLVFFMGFTGMYLQQTFFLAGLSYTNASFASSIQTTIPVFSALIAIILKVENVAFKRIDGIAKMCGVCLCVTGAVVMSLYKGPAIIGPGPVPNSIRGIEQDDWMTKILLSFGAEYWQIGSFYLIINALSLGLYNSLVVVALRVFPSPISISLAGLLVGAVMLLAAGLFTISDFSQWVVTQPESIICVAFAGIVASGFSTTAQVWSLQKVGPIMTTAFNPLQLVFASILGLAFSHDSIFLGVIAGSVLNVSGLYLVIWARAREKALLETDSFPVALNIEAREPLLSLA